MNKKILKANRNKSLNNRVAIVKEKEKKEIKHRDDTVVLDIIGLNCAHCATLIEESIEKLEAVDTINLNFIKKELKINFKKDIHKDKELANISKLIDSIETGVKIKEREKQKSIKMNIIGLDCADCANKIEEKIKKLDTVDMVNINFIKKEMTISFKQGTNKQKEIEKIGEFIDSIEAGVKIEEKKDKNNDIDEDNNTNAKLIRIILGSTIFAIAIFAKIPLLHFVAYFILGYDILLKALKNIRRGKIFNENFLMSIATVGAITIGEYPEAVAVMLFYQFGEYFQELAVGKSRKSIKSLIGIKAEYATRENGEQVEPEDINIDDIIIVKAGEKIPLDGEIIEGSTFLDMSALIGESVPRRVSVGEEVLSGSINKNSIIKIKVTKGYENSTVSKILELVENSYTKKSKAENFITQFAKVYTPIVVISAIIIAFIVPLFTGYNFEYWLRTSLVFLVSSCPCALVVSVPLSFFSGIGSASKRGILIKGSMYMQNLSLVDTIVFDKTGTLTKGVFEISEIKTNNIEEKELLKTAYILENLSIHPIAKSISEYYVNNINESIAKKIENFEEISGFGLKGDIAGDTILVGNHKLLEKYNIDYEKVEKNGSIVYVAKNGKYLGYILVSDIIKDEAKDTMKALKSIGIKETIMLSGDRKSVADNVAKEIGIDKAYSELLPQDKVSEFEKLVKNNKNGKIAFIGDGINDAPVLAISDVGFAMGGVGSDAAIEAADIVIMNDDLNKIYESIIISKNTLKIVKMNVIFSLAIKFIVLGLAVFGFVTSMWLAIFADVGVSIIAILNAMRKKI